MPSFRLKQGPSGESAGATHTVARLLITVPYCILLYLTVPYCTLLYPVVPYCTLLCPTVPYCILLYRTVRYCTLYPIVPYCTLLYPTVLQFARCMQPRATADRCHSLSSLSLSLRSFAADWGVLERGDIALLSSPL